MRLNQEEQKKAHRRSRERPRHTEMLHLSEDLTRLQPHIHPDSTHNKHSFILSNSSLFAKDTFHAGKADVCDRFLLFGAIKVQRKSLNAASDIPCPVNRCIVSRSPLGLLVPKYLPTDTRHTSPQEPPAAQTTVTPGIPIKSMKIPHIYPDGVVLLTFQRKLRGRPCPTERLRFN